MEKRSLGSNGLEVSCIGLGCMSMTGVYGSGDEAGGGDAIRRALDVGVTFFDTAELYGPYRNEELVGRALAGRRDEAIIATKFGVAVRDGVTSFNSRPENVRASCESSLRRLGTDRIDLYYQHRLDPDVPIEETVGALAELCREGKVRHIGLSEVGPDTIRRAHAVHPVAAVQSEYSLWTRDVERDVMPVIRELNIGLVPYSPLGRGFLTGRIRSVEDLADDDWRRNNPRFQPESFAANLELVRTVESIANAYRATPAQVAIAWVLSQGPHIVPIPGTKRAAVVEENAGAAAITLAPADLERLAAAFRPEAVSGGRYA
ncbi:MAG: aldo/keto reductase [Myxococcota bacterium]